MKCGRGKSQGEAERERIEQRPEHQLSTPRQIEAERERLKQRLEAAREQYESKYETPSASAAAARDGPMQLL